MQPFLIENQVQDTNNNQQILKLVEKYFILISSTALLSIGAFIAFICLNSVLTDQCGGGGVAYWLTVPQTISYALMVIFSISSIYLINGGINLKSISAIFLAIEILKFQSWSLIASFEIRNRNWGNCYISHSQGILFIVDNFIEIALCLMLYICTRKVYFKLIDLEMLHIISIKDILKKKL